MSNRNPRLRDLNLKRPPEVVDTEEPIDATEYLMLGGKEESEDDYKTPLKDVWAVTQDITVNKSIGQYSNGDTITAGTRLSSILQKILVDRIVPNFSNPNVGLRFLGTGNNNTRIIEVGTDVTPSFEFQWSKNDAGVATDAYISTAGEADVNIFSSLIEGQWVDIVDPFGTQNIRAGERNYIVSVDHEAGGNKQDNFGDPVSNPIGAATVTESVKYVGRRYIFAGHSNDEPTTSSDLRSLTGRSDILDAQKGKEFTIDVPSGATSAEFAYPVSLGEVQQIEFVGAITSDVTANWTRTTVTLNEPDGAGTVDYYVYREAPSDPYSNIEFNITI